MTFCFDMIVHAFNQIGVPRNGLCSVLLEHSADLKGQHGEKRNNMFTRATKGESEAVGGNTPKMSALDMLGQSYSCTCLQMCGVLFIFQFRFIEARGTAGRRYRSVDIAKAQC